VTENIATQIILSKKTEVKCKRCGGDMKPMADKKTWLCPAHNCMTIERNGQIIGVMKWSSWKVAPSNADRETESAEQD
jgi:tRNA(Ile2) C34 agmatinyltransferase TiaS